MKVVFTGGGTGGHFYPIIAVAQELNNVIDRENIAESRFYYFADDPYDTQVLFEQGIEFRSISAGKLRVYFSIENFTDAFKTLVGFFQALFALFSIFPDIVFAKGGYSSFPTVLAARVLGIPVMIHESDSVPGRVNKFAGKFAKRIAISYKEASEYFPKEKTALTGQPVRKELLHPNAHGAEEYLQLEENVPTILILGGSQGAQLINDAIINALPKLVRDYQIIHQTGEKNFDEVKKRAETMIGNSPNRLRYRPFAFLNPLAMSMSAALASVVISRAGSTIFEIAAWGVPSIIIPFEKSNGDHAKKNAFNYARTGSCVVMEEKNLGPQIVLSELHRITDDPEIHKEMSENAKAFFQSDAAQKIAEEIVAIGLAHEK